MEELPPRIGPYEIRDVLGRGGMGVVYRAYRAALKREFALKVIRRGHDADLESVARFRREAEIAARLHAHPGIVAVHDVGTDGPIAYFAMDCVEGHSLEQRIDEQDLSAAESADYVEQAARALHFAHASGVLHRDVKPGNILLTPDGRVRVTDFGLARQSEADGATERLTRSGVVLGTPSYMSPEQATGRTLDARADVYALGATLYECLAGVAPFAGSSVYDVLDRVIRMDPMPLRRQQPDVSRDLETIAMKCLEKDPDRRYPTAEALASDLARFRAGEPLVARPLGYLGRCVRSMRRSPLLWAAAATTMLALASVMAVLGVRAASDAAEDDAAFEAAQRITPDAPGQALGILETLRQRTPAYPGLADAETAARSREVELERAAAVSKRREQAVAFNARGAVAQQRFEKAETSAARDEAWYQAWGFYAGAREMLAQDTGHAAYAAASDGLADLAWRRLEESERTGDGDAATRFLALLRTYGTRKYARQLEGAGTLTLHTTPRGATVECYAFVDRDGDGRLEEERRNDLGVTPLERVPLPMGSYLLVLRAEGRHPTRYPVLIERMERDVVKEPVPLPPAGSVDADWIYVPPGESILGGDPRVPASGARRRVWVPGFLMARHEVTIRDYVGFIRHLIAEGRLTREQIDARCPRDSEKSGHHWWIHRERGTLVTDTAYDPDWPIFGISWFNAHEFCEWHSQRVGYRVRLPIADEWERAARGADGRAFPWGDGFDWSWCIGGNSPIHSGSGMRLHHVLAVAADVSPFGVGDMAGGVAEWCADEEAPGVRAARGGAWGIKRSDHFRCAHPHGEGPKLPHAARGFRLVRDLAK